MSPVGGVLQSAQTTALRLPSVAATVAATLVVTVLGRRMGGTAMGLLAGLIFAILPVTNWYAQETRSSAAVILGSAVALLCLILSIERPSRGRLAGYAAAAGFAGILHPLNGLLMLAGYSSPALSSTSGLPATSWWFCHPWLRSPPPP
ncbi:glycosyltransferase family 39 protein [Micromonospora arborensis]|uniref:glycosyltransferase family 39 protein n=1 Tax=Micromonospora arborensis TaxID=2116518 RepID=UPI00371273C0